MNFSRSYLEVVEYQRCIERMLFALTKYCCEYSIKNCMSTEDSLITRDPLVLAIVSFFTSRIVCCYDTTVRHFQMACKCFKC